MPTQATLLIVEDDPAHRIMLTTLVGGWGYETDEAEDGSVAVERVRQRPFDLILMDIRMLKVSGLEALEQIKAINPAIPVIIMTAYSSVETAVEALKKGAYDYLTKPLDFNKLKITIQRAMEHTRLKIENRRLREDLKGRFNRNHIIGHSPAIKRMLATVSHVAPTEATVMLTGESGTGKELIAAALHNNSDRNQGPFIKINCAAITETLLESELFGHEKGAFTGATRRKEGCFVQADGGSLFLDEIGEMPLTMQVKLLRVLQEREITRVGGETVIKVDVRLIVATNRDLPEMIQSGGFREDLYYRLNVVGIKIPSLRDHREDIPLLAQHFLKVFSDQNRKAIKGFSPHGMDQLIRHPWPGNVRELMNAVERAVVLARSDYIRAADLPVIATESEPSVKCTGPGRSDSIVGDQTLETVEQITILNTLDAADGNKSEAARRLGITRKTLHKKLKKYGRMS